MSISMLVIAAVSLTSFHGDAVEDGVRDAMYEDIAVLNRLLEPLHREWRMKRRYDDDDKRPLHIEYELRRPEWVPSDDGQPRLRL